MYQLFNKENNGSVELNRLTGTFAAAANYDLIEQEILFATNEVAGLVGNDVIEEASNQYLSGVIPKPGGHGIILPTVILNQEFVDAVRLPIAVLAVSRWVQRTTLTHGNSGRKVKADDNEKVPFSWMLDRDDQAMTEQYYRSLDALYTYLEANSVPEWEESGKKRAFDGSLVKSLPELEAIYPIDGSYFLYYRLQSLVLEIQEMRLRGFLGKKWADITAEEVAEDDRNLLNLARRYAVLKALTVAVRRWSLEAFPLKIARRFSPSYQGNTQSAAATMKEIDWFVGNIEQQLKEIQDLMTAEMNGGESGWEGNALVPPGCRRDKFYSVQ